MSQQSDEGYLMLDTLEKISEKNIDISENFHTILFDISAAALDVFSDVPDHRHNAMLMHVIEMVLNYVERSSERKLFGTTEIP